MDDTRFSAAFGLREAAEIAVAPYCHSPRVNRAVAADPSLMAWFAQSQARRQAIRTNEVTKSPVRAGDSVRLIFPYEGLGVTTILSVRHDICGLEYELDLPDPHGTGASWFVDRQRFKPV